MNPWEVLANVIGWSLVLVAVAVSAVVLIAVVYGIVQGVRRWGKR